MVGMLAVRQVVRGVIVFHTCDRGFPHGKISTCLRVNVIYSLHKRGWADELS